MFYKMVYQSTPPLLYNLLPCKVEKRTHHNLRNKGNIDTPRARIDAHKYSFLPSTIKDWNQLDLKIKEAPSVNAFKRAITKFKEPPPPHYYLGKRRNNAHHARLRIGCSALRKDLFSQLHAVPSPLCACGGGGGVENAIHYFYDCTLYANERLPFMDQLYTIEKFTMATLLYGDKNYSPETNKKFVECVHSYMESTKRFT